jgi:hypothetical protein
LDKQAGFFRPLPDLLTKISLTKKRLLQTILSQKPLFTIPILFHTVIVHGLLVDCALNYAEGDDFFNSSKEILNTAPRLCSASVSVAAREEMQINNIGRA